MRIGSKGDCCENISCKINYESNNEEKDNQEWNEKKKKNTVT